MKKGFLQEAWEKAVVFVDDQLSKKIEQYMTEASEKLSKGDEPGVLQGMKFMGVTALKAPVENLRKMAGL